MSEAAQRIIDIDMRGQVCPATLLVAMAALNQNRTLLLSGEARLCIKTDNREATATIPTTAENMGYEVKVTKLESCYNICVGLFPNSNG